jgi:cytochrome c
MHLRRSLAVLALAALHALPAPAQDTPLWKARRCDACHRVERKLVGPSFQEIAARYRGQEAMVEPLAQKIRHGGSGAWGVTPMTANKHVSEAEARELARWVLSLRP